MVHSNMYRSRVLQVYSYFILPFPSSAFPFSSYKYIVTFTLQLFLLCDEISHPIVERGMWHVVKSCQSGDVELKAYLVKISAGLRLKEVQCIFVGYPHTYLSRSDEISIYRRFLVVEASIPTAGNSLLMSMYVAMCNSFPECPVSCNEQGNMHQKTVWLHGPQRRGLNLWHVCIR